MSLEQFSSTVLIYKTGIFFIYSTKRQYDKDNRYLPAFTVCKVYDTQEGI